MKSSILDQMNAFKECICRLKVDILQFCAHIVNMEDSAGTLWLTFMELQLVHICLRLLGLSSFSFPWIRFCGTNSYLIDRQ